MSAASAYPKETSCFILQPPNRSGICLLFQVYRVSEVSAHILQLRNQIRAKNLKYDENNSSLV